MHATLTALHTQIDMNINSLLAQRIEELRFIHRDSGHLDSIRASREAWKLIAKN